ncbi:MAG TPA: HPr family phosphocarrier protein [Burkholderiaceae bacterium]|nr:HPr family phosphocarrier protein [Burkholderiaceae bacterium]
MQVREVRLANPHGLHARPSAKLVEVASRFRSDVTLVIQGRRANARHIVAVLLLAASVGSTVRVEVAGPDEDSAISEIVAVLQNAR